MDPLSALAVDVLGTPVVVRAPAAVLDELRPALADLSTGPSADGPGAERRLLLAEGAEGLTLHDGDRLVRSGIAPVVAAATVVWHLNAIAAEGTGHVLLHAGCVADEAGGAVLLPGRSGAGKSTLTAACVAAGLAYLSDELAALDPATGTMVPYPKPIGLDGERLVAASALGGGPVAAPTAPTALVFPRYEPGRPLREVPLAPGWALLALVAHAPNLAALGGAGLAWLAGLALACPARQVIHGDAGAVVPLARELAGRAATPLAPAPLLDPVTPTTTTVALGTELAVLDHRTGQVHLLNPAAAAVWCATPAVVDDIDAPTHAAAVVRELARSGAPMAPDDVSATLDQLVRAGLLPRPAS